MVDLVETYEPCFKELGAHPDTAFVPSIDVNQDIISRHPDVITVIILQFENIEVQTQAENEVCT